MSMTYPEEFQVIVDKAKALGKTAHKQTKRRQNCKNCIA